MGRRSLVLCLLAASIIATSPPVHAATETVTIQGGFLFTSCLPTKAPPVPPGGSIPWTCASASTTNGGITGGILGRFTGFVDPVTGNASGATDAWFYGMTAASFGSASGLHFRGTSRLDGVSGGYSESATIVGGTCWFSGATGTIRFYGYLLGAGGGYGGYTATITRPVGFPAPTCNPYGGIPIP